MATLLARYEGQFGREPRQIVMQPRLWAELIAESRGSDRYPTPSGFNGGAFFGIPVKATKLAEPDTVLFLGEPTHELRFNFGEVP
jgi:hypothetical protein